MSNTIGIVLIVIISILLLFVIGLLILFFIKPNHKGIAANETTEKKLADIMLQNQSLKTQLETMQKTYANLNETINQTGSASVKNIATLSEKIETLDKFQKDLNKYNGEIKTNLETLFDVTKTIPTISSEIKGIADIYKNAKQRGSFGEFQLSTILKDIFGADSNLVMSQYSLKNGGVVDFIVKVGEHIVPIDAKFPLDNYKKIDQSENANDIDRYKQQFKRDVIAKFKEASKYISPVEGIDNVIIFIPSEGIFGNIIEWYGNELLTEANEYHVLLCSPTTITAMLKLFLVNEKDKILSKNIENIKKQIIKIFVDFDKVAKNWNDYIKNLFTLTNKARQLTHTNTQILKKVKHIETDNQVLLNDIDNTINESIEIKDELEQSKVSLQMNDDEI